MRILWWSVVLVMLTALGSGSARADTSADCGRFYLKYDPKSQTMKCVAGKRKKKGEKPSVERIRREQRTVQRILTQVQDILTLDELGAEQQQRVRQLISEARQRVQRIRRQTTQLRQEQISYSQEIAAAAQQRTRAQIAMSRTLEQQQRDLVRQLEARQRQLVQAQQRLSRSQGR